MRIDRAKFFAEIRNSMHKGHLSPEQVASYEAILDAAEGRGVSDPRHLSYILATTRGEVGSDMQPVREIGRGKGKKYGVPDPVTREIYYGRGFTQLTWADNYRKMGKRLGIDLYRNPDLALDRKVAAQINRHRHDGGHLHGQEALRLLHRRQGGISGGAPDHQPDGSRR